MKTTLSLLAALGIAAASAHAQTVVRITEWMYNGSEFVEFTNLGSTAVDFTGWSYADDSRVAGAVSLSLFGIVSAGESVILSEASADAFRTQWSLSSTVKVIGGNSVNLSRADEINLYDSTGALQDRLTFGDNAAPGGPRTDTASGWTTVANLGTNNAKAWVRSTVGDAQGSYTSATGGLVANPGVYAVPEPATCALAALGAGVMLYRLRRRA